MTEAEIQQRMEDIRANPYVIRQQAHGVWGIFERIPNLLSPYVGESHVLNMATLDTALEAVKRLINPRVIRIGADGEPIKAATAQHEEGGA